MSSCFTEFAQSCIVVLQLRILFFRVRRGGVVKLHIPNLHDDAAIRNIHQHTQLLFRSDVCYHTLCRGAICRKQCVVPEILKPNMQKRCNTFLLVARKIGSSVSKLCFALLKSNRPLHIGLCRQSFLSGFDASPFSADLPRLRSGITVLPSDHVICPDAKLPPWYFV